jgi:diaminohydroxyphosphoribosylaminopyrimidine deaminase/5-amino-6-(5-phosphoribosylamino)uracil reductase
MDMLNPDDRRSVLRRAQDDVDIPPLYGPLLAAPTAPDGCFVLGRIAQSLDGRIATASGESRWISGRDDILHTHRLRALFDAVLVGAGTVAADDPQLTTREVNGPSPVRVILDPRRRLGADRRVFRDGPPTLLVCAENAPGPACDGPVRNSIVESLPIPCHDDGGLDLPLLLRALAARGLRRLFVEGGGVTVSRFLAAGCLDRLHVTIAPLVLGGGIPAFSLPCTDRLADGLRCAWSVHRLGEDILVDIPIGRARPGNAPPGSVG